MIIQSMPRNDFHVCQNAVSAIDEETSEFQMPCTTAQAMSIAKKTSTRLIMIAAKVIV